MKWTEDVETSLKAFEEQEGFNEKLHACEQLFFKFQTACVDLLSKCSRDS
jgi:hypothetical protein